MKTFISLIACLSVAALVATGCSKKESSGAAGGVKVDAAAPEETQLRQLNIAAGSYAEMTGRFPQGFQELMEKKLLTQIPLPKRENVLCSTSNCGKCKSWRIDNHY